MKKRFLGKMSLDKWANIFVESIFPNDLLDEVVDPFFKYLADLEVLIPCDGDMWEWKGFDSQLNSENLIDVIKNDLESLCDLNRGFVLPYFIGYKEIYKKPLQFNPEPDRFFKGSLEKNKKLKHSEGSLNIKPASDLSNLQIVKKIGKQLQPYLQIEASITTQLTGKYVSKQDAQKLFHYMFGKMGMKAEPRVWEQLSRKRHR
jgi:hypothetical protein